MSTDDADGPPPVEALETLVGDLGSLVYDSALARDSPELADQDVLERADAAMTAAVQAIARVVKAGGGEGAMDELRVAIVAISDAAKAAEDLRVILDEGRPRRRN